MEPVHIISLGAGVQSSTMALMAAKGELPDSDKVVAAIFADTQDEPDEVYDYLDWLKSVLPFPVLLVSEGKLSEAVFEKGKVKAAGKNHYIGLPTHQPNGFGQRHCTKYFKVLPIRKKAKEIAGKLPVIMWIGISTDEVIRCKPTGMKWITNTWPLIDKRMNRADCKSWLEKNGYPVPPKSACIYCPYNSNTMWRRFRNTKYWNQICDIDDRLRQRNQYLHKTLKPIRDVDFSNDVERGQGLLNGFGNECEGMCGV